MSKVTKLRNYLLGKPLSTASIIHERLTNLQGLAIFGSDAMSSTAYATEEILIVLAGAGALASGLSIPIALSISGLILFVTISYQQVVHAHPEGGGVYSVASKELGQFPALVGGAALLIDYVLTAAVSTAAGIAAITSAFPTLYPYRVLLSVLVILLLTWANLRGVRETGRLFLVPPYAFVILLLSMIGYGIWRYANGSFPNLATTAIPAAEPLGFLGALLFIRAFAGGCTAMTGIEAISNGVQAFRPPEAKNASIALLRLSLILGSIFVGITLLANWGQVVPLKEETVVSQIARGLFGRIWIYYAISFATMFILLLAANTPFADFPRVASQLAKDGYFPRQFLNLGSRLVFTNGVVFLSGFAIILIIIFQGSVHALIPLYAVGVFLCFSLSQFGMVMRWRRLGGHKRHILLNATGSIATFIAFLSVLYSKFAHGAWILIPSMVLIIWTMKKIRAHYELVEQMLDPEGVLPREIFNKKTMVVLVANINRGVIHAVQFAKSLNPAHLRALHVTVDKGQGEQLRENWLWAFPEVPVDVVYAEFRDINGAVLGRLKELQKEHPDESIIVVIVELVPQKFWQHFLHNQTALRLRYEIEQDPDLHADILNVPVKINPKFHTKRKSILDA